MGRSRTNISRQYFEYSKVDNKSICLICNTTMMGEHAGNLERHLKRNHKNEFHAIERKRLKLNERSEQIPSTSKVQSQQLFDQPAVKPDLLKIDLDRKQVTKACLELIIVNGCSFEMLEYSGFKRILNPIVSAIGNNFSINSENVKSMIPDVAQNIITQISKMTEKKLISLNVDITTRLNRSILGINAQLIIDGKITLFTLGMVELKDRPCGIYIKKIVQKILRKYNIDGNQIYSITTDNSTNMIEFVSLLKDEFDEEPTDRIDNFEEFEFYDIMFSKLNSIKCAVHTLQLAIKDSINCAELNDFIIECRELVKELQVSRFKNNYVKPVLDCPTRWNTTYSMLESLLKSKNICLSLAKHDQNYFFNEEKWDKLELIVATLRPLAETTLKLQTDQMTLSDFYGIWMETKLKLQKLNNSFASILIDNLSNREKILLENDSLLGAVFLDPRFQIVLDTSQKMQAIQHLKNIWNKLEYLQRKQYEVIIKIEPELSDKSNDDGEELEVFLKQKELALQAASLYTNVDINSMLNNFNNVERVDRKKVILEYWEESKHVSPILYSIASVVLAVPPTKVSLEKSFSDLKLILRENKGSLSENMLENILFIRGNYKLFENI